MCTKCLIVLVKSLRHLFGYFMLKTSKLKEILKQLQQTGKKCSSIHIWVILGLPSSCNHTACTKMAAKLAWILTHVQAGFQSHSSEGCNTEERQDSVTHKVYSQQGGAHSTAGPALGCGKESHVKAEAAAQSNELKLTRHTHTIHTHPPRLSLINTRARVWITTRHTHLLPPLY